MTWLVGCALVLVMGAAIHRCQAIAHACSMDLARSQVRLALRVAEQDQRIEELERLLGTQLYR
jgi:hypothetical protein